ncbi:MFS transporter [Marinobacterium nitratireducens]|uniref:MFS transporter n=1 Tax=Marinobacterium nitratireducens TaxID=518897 RepID=A0A918DXS4_9GAMM|nr:MFS transporter [Marinobacterium nitratireducens]GGO87393.1 MFS transporter [Marinobacterium nitratireducens]
MRKALPSSIWVLGFGSLFMDISSELIHSLLPLFMVTVLGSSMITVGLIEGVAEATAAITKVFSGALSDALGRRKWLMVTGYGLAALTKPLFPLAPNAAWVFAARFIDRLGKGIRGAPRDALIADITPAAQRGAAYGLRQALDSVGAFVGPGLAVVCMLLFDDDIQAAMWVALFPALITVLLLAGFVREPEKALPRERGPLPRLSALAQMPVRYWLVVGLGAVFTLARFSEAFLVLRARDVGLDIAWVPLVMLVMSACYALGAYPAGAAADRMPARHLLLLGLVLLIAADLVLARAATPVMAFAGAALWGGHMAFTQGLLSKLVADTSPKALRGTAFGLFNFVTGIALLLASLIAGWLWDGFGPQACFLAGALFAALTACGLLLYDRSGVRSGGV